MLDKCCFCLKLRLGALIIAYIQLIGPIIGLVLIFIEMAADGAELSKDDDIIIYCVLLSILIIFLIFDILLLVGIFKKKRGCITAYLVFSIILTTLVFFVFIISMFGGLFDVSAFICTIIALLLNVYFMNVIRSYQMTMDEGAGQVLYTSQGSI